MNEKHVELLAEALDDVLDIGPRSTRERAAESLLASEPFRRLLDGVREEERACPAHVTTLEHDIDSLSVWAVRYALGRMTYAVGDVVDVVIRNLSALSEQSRSVIARDIDEAPGLGMEMDREQWTRLRAAILDRALGGRSEQP